MTIPTGLDRTESPSQHKQPEQPEQIHPGELSGRPATPVVVFDIGGVLVEHIGYDAFRAMIGPTLSDQEIRSRWILSPAVDRFETGRMSETEFAQAVVSEFGLPMSPDAFLVAFASWPVGFYSGAQELVARVRATFRTGCLSNSNVIHWLPVYESMFDFCLSSHLEGLAKPSPEVFDRLAQVAFAPRDQIHFFDDSMINIEAARASGFQAHHVMGIVELDAALRELGLSG